MRKSQVRPSGVNAPVVVLIACPASLTSPNDCSDQLQGVPGPKCRKSLKNQERKFSPKRKFLAGCPCGHPAKNFGQALEILEKQAIWNGHPARTSIEKLRSEKLRADFLFPKKGRPGPVGPECQTEKCRKSRKSHEKGPKRDFSASFWTLSALFWHSGPAGPGRPF